MSIILVESVVCILHRYVLAVPAVSVSNQVCKPSRLKSQKAFLVSWRCTGFSFGSRYLKWTRYDTIFSLCTVQHVLGGTNVVLHCRKSFPIEMPSKPWLTQQFRVSSRFTGYSLFISASILVSYSSDLRDTLVAY